MVRWGGRIDSYATPSFVFNLPRSVAGPRLACVNLAQDLQQ